MDVRQTPAGHPPGPPPAGTPLDGLVTPYMKARELPGVCRVHRQGLVARGKGPVPRIGGRGAETHQRGISLTSDRHGRYTAGL